MIPKRERLLRDLDRDPGILILAYPYARTWRDVSQEPVRESWTRVPAGERAALYIHVPFCHRKCMYCDFLAYYGRPGSEIEHYLGLLRQEIRQVAEMAGHVTVESMEFGGGTPSLLLLGQVASVMNELTTSFRFAPNAQFTMEVFPDGSVTKELMARWRRTGVNRLSFGVQFLDDDLKRTMHRSDTSANILRILCEAREAGFDDYNVDLMCGCPAQTEESWRQTYRKIFEFRPTHVCVFPVSVRHEGISLYKRRTTLPPPSRSRLMYEEALEQLSEAGYERTTRHNFRLGAHDCTYERMMAQLAPLIGLGAHAVSHSKDCIYKNHSHLGKYAAAVSKGDLAAMTGYTFPDEEKPYNFAVRKVENLRLDGRDFTRQYEKSLREVFPEEIGLLEEFGLARMSGGDLELTEDGVYYTASVKRTFFHPSAWERFEAMRPEEFKVERGAFDSIESLASLPV